jgi:hypothetical protein
MPQKKKRNSVLKSLNMDFRNKLSSMFAPKQPMKPMKQSTSVKKWTPSPAPNKISPNKISPKHISPNKISPKHISPKHISPKHISLNHISPKHISPKQPIHIDTFLKSVNDNRQSLENDLYKFNKMLLNKLHVHINKNNYDIYTPKDIQYFRESIKMLTWGFLIGMNSALILYNVFF